MPSHLIHSYMDRSYFGKVYWKVHREMDCAYRYFRGRHRIFFHDPISACAIAAKAYPGDKNAISSALMHIEIDLLCSANPFYHKQLELLAKEDALKRKRSNKRKTKTRKKKAPSKLSELEKTENFFKELIEFKFSSI